jgi:exonuclease III
VERPGSGGPQQVFGSISNVIRKSRCDIVCIQESKLNEAELNYIARALPSFFHECHVTLAAISSAGGCFIAWKRSYNLINSWSTKHTCSAMLCHIATQAPIVVTNVYGPSRDEQKEAFISELHTVEDKISDNQLSI